jgi:hypothetical protein
MRESPYAETLDAVRVGATVTYSTDRGKHYDCTILALADGRPDGRLVLMLWKLGWPTSRRVIVPYHADGAPGGWCLVQPIQPSTKPLAMRTATDEDMLRMGHAMRELLDDAEDAVPLLSDDPDAHVRVLLDAHWRA